MTIADRWAEAGWGADAPPPSPYRYVEPLSTAVDDLVDVLSHKGEGFYLGLPAIDALIRGVRPKQLALIIGIAHSGKTQVLLNAILHNLDRRILFFSLDDSREMILTNLVCMSEGVSAEQVEKEMRTEHRMGEGSDWPAIIQNYAENEFKNLIVVDDSLTLDEMTEAVTEAEALWGAPPQAVFIDYLQSIRLEQGGDEFMATQRKAAALKGWCKEHAFPVLCIHQGTKTGSPPGAPITILSGAYAGHDVATFVVGVRRKRDNEQLEHHERQRHRNTVTLHLAKNKQPPSRQTGPDGIDFFMYGETGLIRGLRDEDFLSPAGSAVAEVEEQMEQKELSGSGVWG